MTNAVSKADLAWWLTSCHARPLGCDDGAAAILRGRLREAVRDTALGRAVMHIIWAIGWRATREGGRVQVAIRYVAEGAGVSPSTAATACAIVADILCADRDRKGWWTLAPECIAACFDLTAELAGSLPEPRVGGLGTAPGPAIPISIPPHVRGRTACPCGQHAHQDAHPSLLFDRETALGTCMTTGNVLAFNDLVDEARIVRWGWDGTGRDSARPPVGLNDRSKVYPEGGLRPSEALAVSAVRGRLGSAVLKGRRRGPFVVTYLSRGSTFYSCLGDLLRGSDRAYGGPKTEAKAEAAAVAIQAFGPQEGPLLLPDRFWTVDRALPIWGQREGSRGRFFVVEGTTPTGADLSILDLDGLDAAPTDPDMDLSAKIRRAVRRVSGGRLSVEAIVATSSTGMQVAVRWDQFSPDAAAMYQDPGNRRTLSNAASAVLRLLGRGGHVDEAVWAAGRYGRRPGWRVGKDGRAVRARLWWARA